MTLASRLDQTPVVDKSGRPAGTTAYGSVSKPLLSVLTHDYIVKAGLAYVTHRPGCRCQGETSAYHTPTREQVTEDAIEQRDVLVKELRQIDIIDGTEHQHIFRCCCKGALQVASSSQHTHDSTHAIVIVILARKLLAAKPARHEKAW